MNTITKKMKRMPLKEDFDRPYTTVDVVIFSLIDEQLQVLLVQRPAKKTDPYPGAWALPGGYVDVAIDKDLLACANRKLTEKTGVVSPYLEQLGSWGGKSRDRRHRWTTTHVYFALITVDAKSLNPGGNSQTLSWFPVKAWEYKKERELAFDHAEILDVAIDRLRSKVEYTSLPAYLLNEPFSLPQLQQAYEQVLDRKIDKSGFRTRALSQTNFLEEVGEMDVGAPMLAKGYKIQGRKQNKVQYFPRTLGRQKSEVS